MSNYLHELTTTAARLYVPLQVTDGFHCERDDTITGARAYILLSCRKDLPTDLVKKVEPIALKAISHAARGLIGDLEGDKKRAVEEVTKNKEMEKYLRDKLPTEKWVVVSKDIEERNDVINSTVSEIDKKIAAFSPYIKHPEIIWTGNVIEKLGLDLNEEFLMDHSQFTPEFKQFIPQKFVMRNAVQEVLSKIKEMMLETKASVDGSHTLHLVIAGIQDGCLYFYEQYCGFPSRPMALNAQKAKESWLGRIFQALVDQKYIEPPVMASDGWDIKVLKDLK